MNIILNVNKLSVAKECFMSRNMQTFQAWVDSDKAKKEAFLYQLMESGNDFGVQIFPTGKQPNLASHIYFKATLDPNKHVFVYQNAYDGLRKKFRSYKHQQMHRGKVSLQVMVNKKTKEKLERIQKQLELSSYAGTMEFLINSYDHPTVKQAASRQNLEIRIKQKEIEIGELQAQINVQNKLLRSKQDKVSQMGQEIQNFLLSELSYKSLKLKQLEEYLLSREDINAIDGSSDTTFKESLMKDIKEELLYAIEQQKLRILEDQKAAQKIAQELSQSLPIQQTPQTNSSPILPRNSAMAKHAPTVKISSSELANPEAALVAQDLNDPETSDSAFAQFDKLRQNLF